MSVPPAVWYCAMKKTFCVGIVQISTGLPLSRKHSMFCPALALYLAFELACQPVSPSSVSVAGGQVLVLLLKPV